VEDAEERNAAKWTRTGLPNILLLQIIFIQKNWTTASNVGFALRGRLALRRCNGAASEIASPIPCWYKHGSSRRPS